VIVSHEAPLVEDQPQPVPAVTATLPAPPPAATFALVGDTENVHGAVKAKVSAAIALVPRPPGPTAATSAV
jgi:hypothetical protein